MPLVHRLFPSADSLKARFQPLLVSNAPVDAATIKQLNGLVPQGSIALPERAAGLAKKFELLTRLDIAGMHLELDAVLVPAATEMKNHDDSGRAGVGGQAVSQAVVGVDWNDAAALEEKINELGGQQGNLAEREVQWRNSNNG